MPRVVRGVASGGSKLCGIHQLKLLSVVVLMDLKSVCFDITHVVNPAVFKHIPRRFQFAKFGLERCQKLVGNCNVTCSFKVVDVCGHPMMSASLLNHT